MKHRLLELRRHEGGGEWNEKRNLAPGFIREEENKGTLLLPTMLGGGGGVRFQVKSTQGKVIRGWRVAQKRGKKSI